MKSRKRKIKLEGGECYGSQEKNHQEKGDQEESDQEEGHKETTSLIHFFGENKTPAMRRGFIVFCNYILENPITSLDLPV